MNLKENLLSVYHRKGYEKVPTGFILCPSLENEFKHRYPEAKSYQDHFNFPYRIVVDPGFSWNFENLDMLPDRNTINWHQYYPEGFQYEVKFDGWGIAHESSPNSMHMTKMHHPLKDMSSLVEFRAYPWPDYTKVDFTPIEDKIKEVQKRGLAVFIWFECTIWETAWYLRGMENLMVDMLMEDEKATYLLDLITEKACYRAKIFAKAGADIIGMGDDIGTQESIMFPEDMYRHWLKPRLKKVIDAVKTENPDILISYHSCGYIEPFINDLIEIGVDILNPVQPECMDFKEIHQKYGDRISFNGTIGTQKLMPYGTPEEVQAEVFRNLDIAGKKGGLFCCPTHLLEPEVPWENIEAYIKACHDYMI